LLGPQGEPDFFSWAIALGAAIPAEIANANAATRRETVLVVIFIFLWMWPPTNPPERPNQNNRPES
jgi:hypothetical protein